MWGWDRWYVRLMLRLNTADEGDQERVRGVIGGVLHNLAIRVTVEGDVVSGSSVEAFLQTLRDRPNMHFNC